MSGPPLNNLYAESIAGDTHSLMEASIGDFEDQERRSPLFPTYRSEPGDSEIDDRSSTGLPWSPPGFRNQNASVSGWFRQDPYARYHLPPSKSPSRSRQTSPEIYQDANEGDQDITLAVNTPLPAGADSPIRERSPEVEPHYARQAKAWGQAEPSSEDSPNNYVRLRLHAEVQHREPISALIEFMRGSFDGLTKTKSTFMFYIGTTLIFAMMLRVILVPPTLAPVPDLAKLSTLAKSFEPLIFYSENGHSQISALQETSLAVWDLGESVRSSNIVSGPQIVVSLDDLSESLNTLGAELTSFFADVDGDVDGILVVMEWARRELESLAAKESSIGDVIYDRMHGIISRVGLLETATGPTALGKTLTDIFGSSSPQRTRATLSRTFREFLGVLEESISSELTHSTALFALFESIDRQFLNLQRIVVRETDTQEQLESDLLSSLWTKVMGGNSAMLRKYEKNRSLLSCLRSRTVNNKHLLMEHHRRLQTLKANLETLRKKLVSPLVRRNDSVTMDNGSVVGQQIKGLEGTYLYLKDVREKQKSKLMEMVYGAKSSRTRLIGVDGVDRVERIAIDA